ncbi:MAG: hypothetical protein QOH59_400, partial [Gemmatimonadales bacterium]|nr:hypothetical protein [Gemmatimonadales bacterium]
MRGHLTSVLVVVAAVGTAGKCNDQPEVTAIEIVPSKVMVGSANAATTFKLEARLWGGPPEDRWSING